MSSNNPKYGIWRDSVSSIITSAAVIILNFILAGLLARRLGENRFEDYLFARRLIAFSFPLATLSIGTGLSRALARNKDRQKYCGTVLRGTLQLLAVAQYIIIAVVFLIPKAWLKHNAFSAYSGTFNLWLLCALFLAGYSGYILLYSRYRGELRIPLANLVNFIYNGLIPLTLLFSLFGIDKLNVQSFIVCWGAVYATGYLFYLFKIPRQGKSQNPGSTWSIIYNEVISYSLPRIPAGILLTATPFVIPYFLRLNNGDAVFFLSGLMFPQALLYLAGPLSQVLLPHSSYLHSKGNTGILSRGLTVFLSFALPAGCVLAWLIWLWSDLIALRVFGEGYSSTAASMRLLSVTALPALLYAPLSSIINGIERKALITPILAIGTAVVLASCLLLGNKLNLTNACYIMIAGQFIPVLLIFLVLIRRIPIPKLSNELLPAIICIGACILSTYSLKGVSWQNSIFLSIALPVLSAIMCSIIFVISGIISKSAWSREIALILKPWSS